MSVSANSASHDSSQNGKRAPVARDVTMRDVARRAGVSIKTVSRVINNQGEISEATRHHVLAVIQEMDYRPNSLARGLVSGRTLSVALIIPQISDPFYPEMVLGAESVARHHGYSVFLCNTNEDAQEELDAIDVLSRKQVDGIILCGTRLSDEQLAGVASRHPVAVLTNRAPAHTAVVTIPGTDGLKQITSHLIQLGHQRIGHLGSHDPGGVYRLQGYQQAMEMYRLTVDEAMISRVPHVTIELARRYSRELLERTPQLTALTCYNDLVAVGAIQAAQVLGRCVPQDLAVVGFDDLPLASLVTPKLTSMHVPRYRLGQMVMELLMRVMEANGHHAEQLMVPLHLVVRESCGGYASLTDTVHAPRDD